MSTTLSAESWIAQCHRTGIQSPHQIAMAAVGFLGDTLAKGYAKPLSVAAPFHAAQIALTLAAVSPTAAGWLLERLALANEQCDRESRAAAQFLADLVETLRDREARP